MVRIGYGRDARTRRAHRALWIAVNGPVPDGLQLDHLCRVRHCVNPSHLEPVTPRQNSLRGETVARRRSEQTHCIHGHPLSGDNLYVFRENTRNCKRCSMIRVGQWKRDHRK